MAVLSPLDAAFEGFRIVREKPGLILAWTGFYLLSLSAMVLILLVPNLGNLAAVEGPGGARDLDQLLARFGPPILVVLPMSMAMLTMLAAAVYRAVLRPEDKAFAYLKLGGDELRLFGLNLLVLLIFAVASAAYGAAVVMLAQVAGPFGGLLTVLGTLGGFAGAIWLWVRLSLAGAATFADRRLRLFSAWHLTHGHFWRLLAMLAISAGFSLVVGLLALALSLLVAPLLGGFSLLGELTHPDIAGVSPLGALALLGKGVLLLVIQTLLPVVLVLVVVYAPPGRAYLRLHPPTPVEP